GNDLGARSRGAMADATSDPDGWSRLADFHRPQEAARRAGRPGLADREAATERDFHAMFASLVDHPVLQAKLGFVRALRVRLPENLAPVTIRAVPSEIAGLHPFRPRTKCIARDGILRAATEDGAEAPQYLPLDNFNRYAPMELDIDSTGLALRSYVASLADAP